MVSSQRRATRSDVSFQTKESECLIDTQHIHTFEGDFFYPSCLLSTVTVTPSDSNYVSRSASLKRVRLKSTEADVHDSQNSECMRTLQSTQEIIADGSNEGGTSHCTVLFCERYWPSGVGGRGCGRRVASGGKDLLLAQSERFQSVKICRL